MAITVTTGSTGSSGAAQVASQALGAFNLTAGQDVEVGVALDDVTATVTSITDTKGNTYSLVLAQNGTGVRTEKWKSVGVGAQAGNVITVHVSPNCRVSAAAEERAGISSYGNTGAGTGSDINLRQTVVTQDGNNWASVVFGFVCQSGDTLTAQAGTERQKIIPAATAVGVAIYDVSMVGIGTLLNMTRLSTARQWAAVGAELRSGGAAVPYEDYAATTAAALQADKDIRYLHMIMPMGGGGGVAPPSGEGQFWPPPIAKQGS